MIEHIEDFHAGFQVPSFPEPECTVQTHVDLARRKSAKAVASQTAFHRRAAGRNRKRRGVQTHAGRLRPIAQPERLTGCKIRVETKRLERSSYERNGGVEDIDRLR